MQICHLCHTLLLGRTVTLRRLNARLLRLFNCLSTINVVACKTADRKSETALKENRESALELSDPGFIIPLVQALLHYENSKNNGFKHDFAGSAELLLKKSSDEFKKKKWISEEETRIDPKYFGSLKIEHVRVILYPGSRSAYTYGTKLRMLKSLISSKLK